MYKSLEQEREETYTKAGVVGLNRHHRHCKGAKNLVPASPHTASGETLFHALRVDAERASSVGICLAK